MADEGDDTKLSAEDLKLLQEYTRARMLEIHQREQVEIDALGEDPVDEKAVDPLFPSSAATDGADQKRPTKGGRRRVEVHVNGLGGELCKVEVDASQRVRDMKLSISSETNVQIDYQRLFIGERELRDMEFIHEVTPPSSPIANICMVSVDAEWQQALDMVSIAGMQLAVVPPRLRGDRDISLAAVRQNGAALEYVTDELQADVDVVLTAVRDDGLALRFAAIELRVHREVVLAAVTQNGKALQYAGADLRRDRDLVFVAVRHTGQAFQFADESLRGDYDYVLSVVAQAGLALEFASTRLQGDTDIVATAVRQDGLALEYASDELRAERSIVFEAVQQNGLALWDADEMLKNDPEIVAACKFG